MELTSLRPSITEMSEVEGVTLIGKIRTNRRTPRKANKVVQRVKKENAEIKDYLSNMSKDDTIELLKLLGEN